MTREEAKDKIKKLLALAHNEGATEAEASRAMFQAKALMRRYELDEQEVLLKQLEQDDDAIIEELMQVNPTAYGQAQLASLPTWIRVIAKGIELGCNVRVLLRSKKSNSIYVCGMEHDVALARNLLQYLVDACYQQAIKSETDRASRSAFRFAMASALQERLRALGTIEHVSGAAPGTSLVVLDQAKQQALEKRYGPSKSKKATASSDSRVQGALNRGYDAGMTQSLNRQVGANAEPRRLG